MGSGAVMLALGLGAVALGGHVFHAFIAIVCGAMLWELVRMLAPADPGAALRLGVLAGAASLAAGYLPLIWTLPLLLAPVLVGLSHVTAHRGLFVAFGTAVLLAGWEMTTLRDDFGFVWMLWLALVVVATDVAGYFAGRLIGGPRFWPRISPKKTWAGTVGGWIAAALVGLGFAVHAGGGAVLVLVSVAMSFASQLGDIWESAIKRRVGVKDSSNLIPGHGGVLDRFDGMLGASIFLLVATLFFTLPQGFAP
ncbi:MAG: phosphatidate cytidylyltransferase [Rhodobacteraceae bacterium]|nr:MAG: phosphatidate cytidylyltransferase [Paracoccaceae bacterium]